MSGQNILVSKWALQVGLNLLMSCSVHHNTGFARGVASRVTLAALKIIAAARIKTLRKTKATKQLTRLNLHSQRWTLETVTNNTGHHNTQAMELDAAVIKLMGLDASVTSVSLAGGVGCSSASTSKISTKDADGKAQHYFMKSGTGPEAETMFKGWCLVHATQVDLGLNSLQESMPLFVPYTTQIQPYVLNHTAGAASNQIQQPTS